MSLIVYINKCFDFYLFHLTDVEKKQSSCTEKKKRFTFKNLIYYSFMLGKLYNLQYPTDYEKEKLTERTGKSLWAPWKKSSYADYMSQAASLTQPVLS